jgi:hypothetical protein
VARSEAEIGPDLGGPGEAAGIVNCCPDRQRDDDAHPQHGHEPATDKNRPCVPDEPAVEVSDLVAERGEQHPDQLGELGLVREFIAGDLGGCLPGPASGPCR